ncbi:hypothetical protein QTO30_07345 [Yoonia sp. GPGPB17]
MVQHFLKFSVVASLMTVLTPNDAAAQQVDVFGYTGADQTFTVPQGVRTIDVKVWGAGGGGSREGQPFSTGGAGAFVSGTIPVTAGDQLTIVVGQGGRSDGAALTSGTPYGFGGVYSGPSSGSGSDGGGLSGIFTGATAVTATDQSRALLIAGGGGAGERAGSSASSGGQGGDLVLAGGQTGTMQGQSFGGGFGGGGGGGFEGGSAGSLRLSQNPSLTHGEGGTSFVAGAITSPVLLATPDLGFAAAFSTFQNLPPNTSDADYQAGVGVGTSTTFSRGGSGLVVISYSPYPEIGSSKSVSVGAVQSDGTFDATYTILVQNTGDVTLDTLTLVDDLTATAQLGTAFNGVITQPTVTAVTISAGSTLPAQVTTYDGTNSLVGTGGVLIPGDSYQVVFTVNIDPNAAGAPASLGNIATAGGDAPDDTTVTDLSDNGTDPTDNPGDPTGDPTPTPVPAADPGLSVVKTGVATIAGGQNSEVTDPGDTIAYNLVVTNTGDVTLTGVQIASDILSLGLDASGAQTDLTSQVSFVANSGVTPASPA